MPRESESQTRLSPFAVKKYTALGVVSLFTVAVGAAFAANGATLFFNGKVASTDVRMISGTPYVKLSDMAKSLDMNVVKRADGSYEITKAGGANQVGSLQGKIGDVLFDGKWRLTVLSLDTVDTYAVKSQGEPYDYGAPVSMDPRDRIIHPKAGNTLIVVRCRVSNGQKTAQTLWLKNDNTALTDTEGQSYPPIDFDVDGAPSQTKVLLPGSKIDIPVVFVVPQGTKRKDLVFVLKNNDGSKGSDARVSLTSSP